LRDATDEFFRKVIRQGEIHHILVQMTIIHVEWAGVRNKMKRTFDAQDAFGY
jgi:hypothetical protein